VTYELVVTDPTTVARVINAAHRFGCLTTRVDARSSADETQAHLEFAGNPTQLARLRAQIDRIVEFEKQFVS